MSENENWNVNYGEKDLDSAVIDMQVTDESEYEINQQNEEKQAGVKPFSEGIKEKVSQNVTTYMWDAGKQQARKAFSIYGNIDILRPYFDVEPHQVRTRLIHSLIPPNPSSNITIHRELYGPLMLVFTLIALLLFQMKTSEHSVREGTLMGTAFAVCFGYWIGTSSFLWVLSYVCNTRIQIIQILSLIGYAMFSHCIVLAFGTIWHSGYSHFMFYSLWIIFGGLACLRLVIILIKRTTGKSQKFILCLIIGILHMCFLLYLHFAYHKIVEELSTIIDNNKVNPNPVLISEKIGDNKGLPLKPLEGQTVENTVILLQAMKKFTLNSFSNVTEQTFIKNLAS